MSQQQIELEEVTLRVPKLIMDFLRKHEKRLEEGTVQRYLERNIVGCVRADIDAVTVFAGEPEDVIKTHKLDPIFKALTNW